MSDEQKTGSCCLSKTVCKKCHERFGKEWILYDDLYWSGINKKKLGQSLVTCPKAIHPWKKTWQAIPTDKGIPVDCLYYLEHYMEATKGVSRE